MNRAFRANKRAVLAAALVPNHKLSEDERKSRDITTACFERQMGAVSNARQQHKMLRLSRTEHKRITSNREQ